MNNIGPTSFNQPAGFNTQVANATSKAPELTEQKDSFKSNKAENNDKVGFFRLAFSRLTPAQIAKVNETGQMPEKSKLISDGCGGYAIANNIFNVTSGTRTVPDTHELKRDFLGFTIVAPKGTQGLFIKE